MKLLPRNGLETSRPELDAGILLSKAREPQLHSAWYSQNAYKSKTQILDIKKPAISWFFYEIGARRRT
ncbi:hypothetical protein [Psychromonas sp. SP041]|uniref:hypothetical protein n=1 Tax=Psychromonas sp. SP041 TaxID=1365007 RepID=UPI00046ED3AC|nr:hypothetical protein [Psychromonas sp. SP041]